MRFFGGRDDKSVERTHPAGMPAVTPASKKKAGEATGDSFCAVCTTNYFSKDGGHDHPEAKKK